ncbi:MAG TPA: helix-turn-helix domain-containing protein [Thermoanaerobaculia bacterium]|nr:helix-turn-helix domain-containing protein [Thermoanaerobaculia bacterium]
MSTQTSSSQTLYLRLREVCEMLGIHRDTLWRWRRVGLFPVPFLGKKRGDLLWRRSDVEEWIARRDAGKIWPGAGPGKHP